MIERPDPGNSPFLLGVTGHRDIAPGELPRLRAEVSSLFRDLARRMPSTGLRLVVGMAAGADLLVAEEALACGLQLEALLPMPLAEFAGDFSPEDLVRLQALLARPGVDMQVLAPPAPVPGEAPASARDRCYARLSATLLERPSLLLALWDGSPSLLPAGTADNVLRFLGVRGEATRHGAPLRFVAARTRMDSAERVVYWVPAARLSQGAAPPRTRPCWLRGLDDDSIETQEAMPAALAAQLTLLDHYNRDHLALRGALGPGDSLLSGLPAGTPVDDDPALAQLDAQYSKADALAVHYQRRSDLLFKLFSVMGVGMGLAYLTYEKLTDSRLLLFLYLLVLLGSLGLYALLERRRWFAKHLTYRALAETLRVKFYLRLVGLERRVDALGVLALSGIDRFHGFSWIAFVLAGAQFADTVPAAGHAAGAAQRAAGVQRAWIDNQRSYFQRKVAQLERASRRVHRLRTGLFVLILAVIATLFAFGPWLHHHEVLPGVPAHNLLTFCTGFFAVLLAVWELHQNKMATRELLWQYRNQLAHFARADERLAGGSAGPRHDAVLVELGRDSLMEGYLWTIHRYHREHEPPAAT